MMFLPMNISFAQDADKYEEFNSEDICGGVKIVNGNRYEMTASEAQSEYLQEKEFEEIIEYNDNEIKPRVVVKTEISSTRSYNGTNKRISPVTFNNTSSPMKKSISGSKTIQGTVSAGVNIKNIVDRVNSTLSFKVGVSATKTETTTVVIKPGERFYITFTPKLVDVKGRQLHSLSHGVTKWENYTATLPRVVSGHDDGTIYYVTK